MLRVNVIMIYIKVTRILKHFFRSIIDSHLFKKIFFSPQITMRSSRLEENKNIERNIIKDIRNLLRLKKLKKETTDTAIKYIRNLFKDRIIRDIRILFEHKEEEICYKPVRVDKPWSNNYIEFDSNGERNKTLSVEKYLNKIRPYKRHN